MADQEPDIRRSKRHGNRSIPYLAILGILLGTAAHAVSNPPQHQGVTPGNDLTLFMEGAIVTQGIEHWTLAECLTAALGHLTLEGRTFPGHIRAKGMLGLFRVKGTLSFREGELIWSAKGSEDSAMYEIERIDGAVRFTSRVAAEDNTYVDWSGTFDGESLSDVKAVWTRTEEDDFIHDLFLPDIVTLVFTPKED